MKITVQEKIAELERRIVALEAGQTRPTVTTTTRVMTRGGHAGMRTKANTEKCAGCGHRLDRHRVYAKGGRNRHGCELVCTVDGCQFWRECQRGPHECPNCGGLPPGECSSAGDLCYCPARAEGA